MDSSNPLLGRLRRDSIDWEPQWTVVTHPPTFAERWAVRAMIRDRQRHVGTGTMLIALLFFLRNCVDAWRVGSGWLLAANVAVCLLVVVAAWDRYAFGQLLHRYDSELRGRPAPRLSDNS
jgi:hypothetical protein